MACTLTILLVAFLLAGKNSACGNPEHREQAKCVDETDPELLDHLSWYIVDHPLVHNRLIGGKQIEPHSKPWIVSIETLRGWHFCSGSILDETTVITAAHCVGRADPFALRISAGKHNLLTYWPEEQQQSVNVQKIVLHPEYCHLQDKIFNDIAILKLAKPLQFNEFVNAVCLPEKPKQHYTGSAEVIGWGSPSSDGDTVDLLNAAYVPLMDLQECLDEYGIDTISEHMICAGEGGKDSCQGNSGGPMMCYDQVDDNQMPIGEQVLCGIVSWGKACAVPHYPGVYTSVSHFLDWIETVMNQPVPLMDQQGPISQLDQY